MVSAIALLGLVALLEGNRNVANNNADNTETTSSTDSLQGDGELLFPFTEDEVDTLEVQRSEDSLVFEKLDDGNWEMVEPEVALAENGAIAFLLSQITNSSAHTLNIGASDLRDFGLQNPDATVTLTANGTTYKLTVGDDDFTGDKLYVKADPPAQAPEESEQIKIHVVSGGMRNAVNRPTQDWLMADESEVESETEDQPDDISSENPTLEEPSEAP